MVSVNHAKTFSQLLLLMLVVTALVLQGCGFHLRGMGGSAALQGNLYVKGSTAEAELLRELRTLASSAGATLVEAGEAELLLTIESSNYSKRVSAVSNSGRAEEYELRYQVIFSMQRGEEVLASDQKLLVSRNMLFDENQVLAQSSEENQLLKEMQREVAQRILRRLQAVSR